LVFPVISFLLAFPPISYMHSYSSPFVRVWKTLNKKGCTRNLPSEFIIFNLSMWKAVAILPLLSCTLSFKPPESVHRRGTFYSWWSQHCQKLLFISSLRWTQSRRKQLPIRFSVNLGVLFLVTSCADHISPGNGR
jgi:hypothetical protein